MFWPVAAFRIDADLLEELFQLALLAHRRPGERAEDRVNTAIVAALEELGADADHDQFRECVIRHINQRHWRPRSRKRLGRT